MCIQKTKFNVYPDEVKLVEKSYCSRTGGRSRWVGMMDIAEVASADGEERE